MDLDLAQVRAFVAVVDHRHFGRAARSLALTQQALSKRGARLEDRLGRLLERRPGGVVLTGAGERFLPAARQLLEIADRAAEELAGTPVAPLRVDVWSDVQTPAALIRAIAHEHPDLTLELSMRRDLGEALAALRRHELDLAFGNVANLAGELPPELSARLVTTDPIAVLVNAHGAFAARERLTPADLVRSGVWWPMGGSSLELRAFVEEYVEAIGAPLTTDASNLGLDAAVEHVAANRSAIAPVVATWPLGHREGVRVVALHPAPHYPWYAVWRTAAAHPALPRILSALRARARPQAEGADVWLPREAAM